MTDFTRRMSDAISKENPHRVTVDEQVNGRKTADERLSDLEHDIVLNTNIMYEVMAQNNKYTEYLDKQMQNEVDSNEFWTDVRKKLMTAGIIGFVGVVLSALWFAATQFMKNL